MDGAFYAPPRPSIRENFYTRLESRTSQFHFCPAKQNSKRKLCYVIHATNGRHRESRGVLCAPPRETCRGKPRGARAEGIARPLNQEYPSRRCGSRSCDAFRKSLAGAIEFSNSWRHILRLIALGKFIKKLRQQEGSARTKQSRNGCGGRASERRKKQVECLVVATRTGRKGGKCARAS